MREGARGKMRMREGGGRKNEREKKEDERGRMRESGRMRMREMYMGILGGEIGKEGIKC